jgi:hypothetical protein
MRVSLVQDEAVESLLRTLAEHLASWGGRPLLGVFDRPNTIALQWQKNGEVTEWNPIFAYATLEMGLGGMLAVSRSAIGPTHRENHAGGPAEVFQSHARAGHPETSEGQLEPLFRRLNLAHTRRIYQDLNDSEFPEPASGSQD